jgi:tagatose-1,6-bisphosphate aldolase
MFGLANFDESEEMIRLLGLRPEDAATVNLISEINEFLIKVLSAECSGIVVDPRVSLSALIHKAAATGVAFRLTEEENLDSSLPKFIPQWGIEETKNNFGVVKLTLPYHPSEQMALEKKKFLNEVHDFCAFEKIPLILDLQISGIGGGKIHTDDLPEAQMAAIQELRTSCDLIALDYPGSVLATATLTAELDIPWVLVSRQESYEDFKNHLREALENGAKGFLAGRPLWQELAQARNKDMTPDKLAIHKFIATTLRDRLIELIRITNEVSAKQPLDLGL